MLFEEVHSANEVHERHRPIMQNKYRIFVNVAETHVIYSGGTKKTNRSALF